MKSKLYRSRVGELWHKYLNSGIGDNPIINDAELLELQNSLVNIANFMRDTDNRDSATLNFQRAEAVELMLEARKVK